MPCINATEYPGGVVAIDTAYVRDGKAASYLVEGDSEVAFIETGTNSSAPRLLAVLEKRGWKATDVRYVIVTHVHLDHAGGAGRLMQLFPNATFLVHPRGARHMIDPSRLEASSRKVYGDEAFDGMYGTLIPVDAERTREVEDGETLMLGDRPLHFIHTPGHASHHFCIWDEATKGWFTGDTFGLSYRELDTGAGPFILPTTTPIDFDPDALRQSIGRMLEKQPECMYLVHYGRIGRVGEMAERLLASVDELVGDAERHENDEERSRLIIEAVKSRTFAAVRAHGVTLAEDLLEQILMPDIELNTQGVEVWLERRKKRALGA